MKGIGAMQELQTFKNEEFGLLTTININGEPWFIGKEVAEKLGYKNTRDAIYKHVDDEDKGVANRDTLGGEQTVTIINESGLYSLILSSKLDSAKRFKRWVTSEVIPSIRKHGVYANAETIESLLSNPENAIKVFTALKDEKEKNKQLKGQVTELKKSMSVYKETTTSPSTMTVGQLAKIITTCVGYPIGQNRLFSWLRENGYLSSQKGSNHNIPKQEYVERGLFKLKESSFKDSDGVLIITFTPMVTQKGQAYFIEKFQKLQK